MRRLLLAVLLLLVPLTAEAGELSVRHVELLPPDVSGAAVAPGMMDRLRYAGGLELRAEGDLDFGGLSGMTFDPASGMVTAISDQGHWYRFRLLFDGERLSGAEALSGDVLRDERGRPLMGRRADSEELIAWRDGWLVSFEQRHRVMRYAALGEAGTKLAGPEALAELPINSGIEAMAALPGGRLLLLTETGRSWVGQPGGWGELSYDVGARFLPTGAAVLAPYLYVVERRFSLLGGFEARLVRHPLESIRPGANLKGEVLGHIASPMTTDNFEAISVARTAGGEVRLMILSDDNFMAFERTLLLSFTLSDP